MRAVTRSVTLDAPIAAMTMLAEIAEDLVRVALADHPRERIITLLAISLSHIGLQSELQLELPFGLPDEKRRPGTRQGAARWSADQAMDAIRARFGRGAIGYAAVALDRRRSVPDEFRELAEKDLGRGD
jgi:DNA polymerase-4